MYRVDKPIYGLSQAGRRWQRTLFPWLAAWCARAGGPTLTPTTSDTCVFRIQDTVQTPDDICTVASHDDEHSLYAAFVAALRARWKVDDEGEIADLLGIEFSRDGHDVILTQKAYIERLLAEHSPDGVPPNVQKNTTPCDREIAQSVADALADRDERDPKLLKRYQSLVGALLYCATHTRPDVAYSVGMLCRCMARPTDSLLAAALRVLHYLHVTRELGLRYSRCSRALYGMSDADWAVEYSTMGYVFMMHQAAISWASRKQASVALSTCEAEIMAASGSRRRRPSTSRACPRSSASPPPSRWSSSWTTSPRSTSRTTRSTTSAPSTSRGVTSTCAISSKT